MATAGDQINRALRLLGVLAEGETPSASTSADALTALNQMIDSWNTERLSVFCTTEQAFTWPASQSSRTLGASGNFVGTRPVRLDPSTYFVLDGVSYPIELINQQQYNSIPVKTTTSSIPQVLFVNMTNPNITMYIYPVPTANLAFKFIGVTPLTEPATTGTTLAIPPGYLRAFAYNLACEIAPEFGIEPPPSVKRIATISKRDIKRINNPNDILVLPSDLVARRYGGNINTGWES